MKLLIISILSIFKDFIEHSGKKNENQEEIKLFEYKDSNKVFW